MNKDSHVFINAFANDNGALIAEVWAAEALMLLWENTVILPTVYRDFDSLVAKQGELVHAHKPAKFETERKVDGDEITIQDAVSTDIQVRMDFHSHTSFMIYDGEESKSFKDLVQLYLGPAMESISQEIDETLAAQKYQFMDNMVGKIGTPLTSQSLIDISLKFNLNNVPNMNRFFMQSPTMEADLQAEKLFTDASQVGDDGTALRRGSIGVKYGIANVMSQNMTQVPETTVKVTGAINLSAGYPVGTVAFTVDGFSAAIAAGSWCKIAGDDRPRRIISTAGAGTPTTITIDTGIESAVVNDAVFTVYTPGAVNQAVSPTGYAQFYTKRIVVDGFTVAPKKGQLVSFGAAAQTGAAIGGKNSTISLKLDQSLQVTTANDTVVGVGPGGDFGMAYTPNAIAFVSRPLVLPKTGIGVTSAVANYKGLAVRITMAYDYKLQGTVVTIDLLHGVKVIDAEQGILVVR